MILAAGRGARLKPITDHTPKPLVEVHGHPLIELQLLRLRQYGITELVINLAYLGDKIVQRLGNGNRYGVNIAYSHEPQGALETAGGIVKALPLLKGDSFLVVNADVICNLDYAELINAPLNASQPAQLVMIPNPDHHVEGDFSVQQGRVISAETASSSKMTFSGIAHYRREVFKNLPPAKHALAPLLRQLIDKQKVSAYQHHGLWYDVGTPARLSAAREDHAVREYIDSLR